MKKALLILIAVVGFAFAANAQNIGVRLGTDGELSYQHQLSDNNRIEADLGVGGFMYWKDYHFLSLTGVYQWHWYLVDTFGWYVGPGAQFSLVQANPDKKTYFNVSVGGQIGIDYEFNIPLQLSLDVRPLWNFFGTWSGFGWGACLGVRYML